MYNIFTYEEYTKLNKKIEKLEKIIFLILTEQFQGLKEEELDITNDILYKYKDCSFKRRIKR